MFATYTNEAQLTYTLKMGVYLVTESEGSAQVTDLVVDE